MLVCIFCHHCQQVKAESRNDRSSNPPLQQQHLLLLQPRLFFLQLPLLVHQPLFVLLQVCNLPLPTLTLCCLGLINLAACLLYLLFNFSNRPCTSAIFLATAATANDVGLGGLLVSALWLAQLAGGTCIAVNQQWPCIRIPQSETLQMSVTRY